jgi:hypothetical protein
VGNAAKGCGQGVAASRQETDDGGEKRRTLGFALWSREDAAVAVSAGWGRKIVVKKERRWAATAQRVGKQASHEKRSEQ